MFAVKKSAFHLPLVSGNGNLIRYDVRNEMGVEYPKYLYIGNPNKLLMLQYLLNFHRQRGHKTLVFIDKLFILQKYAALLGLPYLDGTVPESEREKILQFFTFLPDWNVLLVSRVGDEGIDLPDANVAIVMSSHFASRKQEAQRLGRILRPKDRARGIDFDSYFYSLVSAGTDEVQYSLKRQKFLIKQGYSFFIEDYSAYEKMIMPNLSQYKMSSQPAQDQFLEELLRDCLKTGPRGTEPGVVRDNDLRVKIEGRSNANDIYIEY